jgi:hypothetical protein
MGIPLKYVKHTVNTDRSFHNNIDYLKLQRGYIVRSVRQSSHSCFSSSFKVEVWVRNYPYLMTTFLSSYLNVMCIRTNDAL